MSRFDTYDVAQMARNSFGFLEMAYACSPVFPTTDDILTNIEIQGDFDFNGDFKSGTDLTRLFDVIFYEGLDGNFYEGLDGNGYQRMDLKVFLIEKPKVPKAMALAVKKVPDTNEAMVFEVKLSIDSEGPASLQFTTKPVRIVSEI